MSKKIAISDKIYERLKKEKQDKSFSKIIEEKLDSGGKITEVTGNNVLDRETKEEVKKEIKKGSQGSLKRMEETPRSTEKQVNN